MSRTILTLKSKPAAPVVEKAKIKPKPKSEPSIKSPPPRETIRLLASTYPQAFFVNAPRKPLVAGIHKQLREAMPHISRTRIRRALKVYCGSSDYYKSFATETHRVGLDGQAAIEVSPEERLYAEKRLELKALRKSKAKPVLQDTVNR